jgi:hypothetical protein
MHVAASAKDARVFKLTAFNAASARAYRRLTTAIPPPASRRSFDHHQAVLMIFIV